jgi:hypothetical protein
MRAAGQRRPGVHARPVLHPPGHPLRRGPRGDLPAPRACLRLHLVLGDPRRGRRHLVHLQLLHSQHRHAGQVHAAAAARRRRAPDDLIRVPGLPQRRGQRTWLPAGPAAGLLPQRPVPRLAVRPVRRRRPGGGGGVLVQASAHLFHLCGQRRDLRVPHRQLRGSKLLPRGQRFPQPGVNRLQLRDPRTQLLNLPAGGRLRRSGHSRTTSQPTHSYQAQHAESANEYSRHRSTTRTTSTSSTAGHPG